MSYAAAILTMLETDAALNTLLTGGLYANKDLPADGIDRDSFPDAFDTNGLMLPWGVVRGRGNIPTFDLRDEARQYTSSQQVVEIWLYADRDAGWDDLEAAAGRAYAVLHDKQIAGGFTARLVNEIAEARDDSLGGACLHRVEYEVTGRRKVA